MKASRPTAYFIGGLMCSCRDYWAKERIDSEHTFAVNHCVLFNNESIHIILHLGFLLLK